MNFRAERKEGVCCSQNRKHYSNWDEASKSDSIPSESEDGKEF